LGQLRGTLIAALVIGPVGRGDLDVLLTRRWPRSSPRCWSPWCWSSARRACSEPKHEGALGTGLGAASGADLVAFRGATSVLPPYHATNLARIMVLAVFAMGYNLAFGYTGLLSLGHALFFAPPAVCRGLAAHHLGLGAGPALIAGALRGAMAAAVGLLALRTAGVSFMIVTLMFAQAGYLTMLYFGGGPAATKASIFARAPAASAWASTCRPTPRALSRRWRCSPSPFGSSLCAGPLALWPGDGRDARERGTRRMLGYQPLHGEAAALISGLYAGAGRGGLCAAVRLCRRQLSPHPVFDPADAVCAVGRGGHGGLAPSSARS
jgi:hypothetical protein